MFELGVVFGLFGLVVGSFLNVVILRHGARSIEGRSGCMSCGRQLVWYDMVPVFSWIYLRGRCRFCRSRISVQYPLVEAGAAVLFFLVGFSPLPILQQLLSLAIVALLIIIAVYDIRHTIIPDGWAYAFALTALVLSAAANPLQLTDPLFLLAGPVVALPLFFLWLVSGGRWMGLGDPKLALGIGWLLGMVLGLYAVFLAFIIGALISVCILMPLPYFMHVLRITRLGNGAGRFTMKSEVAFGPFLIASCLIVWFFTLYGVPLPLGGFGT